MYDIAIIGGGPGGYATALYAHNFGLSVALIELILKYFIRKWRVY